MEVSRFAIGPGTTELIDLHPPIGSGSVSYTGLPGPRNEEHLTREASHHHDAAATELRDGRIEMVADTGMYLDSSCRRDADGHEIDGRASLSATGWDRALASVDQTRAVHASRQLEAP